MKYKIIDTLIAVGFLVFGVMIVSIIAQELVEPTFENQCSTINVARVDITQCIVDGRVRNNNAFAIHVVVEIVKNYDGKYHRIPVGHRMVPPNEERLIRALYQTHNHCVHVYSENREKLATIVSKNQNPAMCQ